MMKPKYTSWKHYLKYFSLIMLLMVILSGCQSEGSINTAVESDNGVLTSIEDSALKALMDLDALGARVAGTPSEKQGADYIVKTLENLGYTVERQLFQYQGGKSSENIIVEKKGTGEGSVIVGAHYDSSDASKGADDNASGVAVVLSLAEALVKQDTIHNIKFVFFGAEEVGLVGSEYYASMLSKEERDDTILMVNLDSLIAGDYAYIYGNGDEKGRYRAFVLEYAKSKQLPLITQAGNNPAYPAGTTIPASDHAPFEALGIPFIYFESTNWDVGNKDGYTQSTSENGEEGDFWHTSYDHFEAINKTFPGRPAERLKLFATILQDVLAMDLAQVK